MAQRRSRGTMTKIIFVVVLLLCFVVRPSLRRKMPSKATKCSQDWTARTTIESIWKDLTLMLTPRVPNTLSHQSVQKHIHNTMESLGWSVELERFSSPTPMGEKEFTNIIATFNPTAERRIILAAHYDSKYFPEPNTFIGATDSALPCALMMDVARTLSQDLRDALDSGRLDELSLELIFFDGEEAFENWSSTDSLYGSRHHAQRLNSQDRIDNIDLFVLLDLLGAAKPTIYPPQAQSREPFSRLAAIEANVRKTVNYYDLDLLFSTHRYHRNNDRHRIFRLDYEAPPIEDDHIPFAKLGVPVAHLIAFPFPSVWHTPADDAQALHNDTIVILASVIRCFVGERLNL